MLIAIEGADAAGKATQTAKLAERFRAQGRVVSTIAFPRYDTPTGNLIARFLRGDVTLAGDVDGLSKIIALQSMFTIDRYEATPAIIDRLMDDEVVIVDRWWASSVVYGSFSGAEFDWLVQISEQLPRPDHFVLLDVPLEISRQRRPDLRDTFESNEEMQRFVRAAYNRMWASPPTAGSLWHRIDGTGTPDEVHALVWEAVQR